MNTGQFVLPSYGCLGAQIISDGAWRLKTFVEKDAYAVYDYQGCYAQPPEDVIRSHHVTVMNSAMRARSSRKGWAEFIDQILPELKAIHFDLDWIAADDSDVREPLAALIQLVERISATKGLKEMAASKVLYLLRPNFVVIADSYVRDVLGIYRSNNPGREMWRIMEAVRDWGRSHSRPLDALVAYANSLGTVRAPNGPLRFQEIPVKLSRVRILDILLWTEMAIHGPTRHLLWSKWFADENSP